MNHDAHLHAEEGEDRVKLPQNSVWITCMKKKAKFKSYSIQNIMMVTCMQKRVKIKLTPERQGGHLHAEEVEEKIPRERHGGHLQAEVGEYKVQHSPEHHGDHQHAEKGRDEVQLNIQNTMEITCM